MKKEYFRYIILAVICIYLFIISHFVLPLEIINSLVDNFYKIALSSSAFLTVYYGNSYIKDQLSRKKLIKYYSEKYAHFEFGKSWELIARKNASGEIFLKDTEAMTKHHVKNMLTMYDLGWSAYQRKLLEDDDFYCILNGDPIRTTGEVGD